jgi:HEAT repeat protein
VLLEYARKGDDDATRAEVITAIAVSGDYLVLEPLQKLAREKQELIALAAVDGLARLRLPEALDDLRKVLPRFTGNDHGRVLRALAACGSTDAAVRELLIKKAKGNDQNIRAHALVGMGSLVPTPEVAVLLKKSIFDRLTMARACAVYAAGKGRYEACREELARQAAGETHVDLKDLAEAALAHLDHDPARTDCCNLATKLENFLPLGDTRR